MATSNRIAAMPAFNEAQHIRDVMSRAKQYVDEVIVVDDGSGDNTVNAAQSAGATVLRHNRNRGKGSAIQVILSEVRKRKPEVLILLDADGQHNPDEIPHFIEAVSAGHDLVIGSRHAEAHKAPLTGASGRESCCGAR